MSGAAGRPRKVRVGPLTYQVLVDVAAIRRASDNASLNEGDEWSAFSDHDSLVIGINPTNPVDVQRRDLLHELLHCCLRHSGVWPNAYASTVAKAGEDDGYTVEEFMVAASSAPLLGVLRDNPTLVRWLVG